MESGIRYLYFKCYITFCHEQKFITCMTAQPCANFKGPPFKYCAVNQRLRNIGSEELQVGISIMYLTLHFRKGYLKLYF